MLKLRIHSMSELVHYAIRNGIVERETTQWRFLLLRVDQNPGRSLPGAYRMLERPLFSTGSRHRRDDTRGKYTPSLRPPVKLC